METGLTEDAWGRIKAHYALAIEGRLDRAARKFYTYYQDEGPTRRELYPRHMEFFAAGAEFPERLFVAANRVGKTDAGAYEVTCHLTGDYPSWWQGRRFEHPVEVWACGTTSETTRDIVQAKLLGPHDRPGTGFIPGDRIIATTNRPHGLPGSVESAYIKHVSGKKSYLGLKTYEQGRKSFEGTAKDVIWDDEEPPMDVYQEQVLRTLTTKGMVFVTFTPLQGMSEVVTSYIEPSDAARESKMYVQAGWDDVPHLDEAEKRRVLATMLPYQIAARTKGEPSLGAGAIFPIPEADIVVPARSFPWTWPRGYGLDVGWNRTAAAFFAQDVGADVFYLYDVHYMSAGEPPSHAVAIRARGEFLEGAIDPASHGRSQIDGRRLIDQYRGLGLTLVDADHAVEAGLLEVWTLLITGRLKVCANCEPWLREFRKYHRDEKGAIVKTNDHLMDGTRYWAMTGRKHMRVRPDLQPPKGSRTESGGRGWMAR
jgi:phage terminase large subunit-like protein